MSEPIKDADSYLKGWNEALDLAIRVCREQRDDDDAKDSSIWNGCIAKCTREIEGEKIVGTFDAVEAMFKALNERSQPESNPDAKDAARYRWLQQQECGNVCGKGGPDEDCYLQLNPRDMDAAIDAGIDATHDDGGKHG